MTLGGQKYALNSFHTGARESFDAALMALFIGATPEMRKLFLLHILRRDRTGLFSRQGSKFKKMTRPKNVIMGIVSIGRAVASDSRGLQFEYNHRQIF